MASLPWIILSMVLSGVSGAVGSGQEAQPPTDSLGSLKREVDDAKAAFNRAYGLEPEPRVETLWRAYLSKAEKNSLKGLEALESDPKSPEAFDFLDWIVTEQLNIDEALRERAIGLLLERHATNPKVGRLCTVLGYYGDASHQPTLELLREVSDKNPDRTARGQACLGLARLTWNKARMLDFQHEENPEPYHREAERLFEMVVDDYGDCPDLRKIGVRRARETLGESAGDELFEMRMLTVGKTAPEIGGEDLDGRPLKLSDYRGKVVLLTFWASWCGPCMAMVPQERALAERMKNRPFALVGINGDEERDVARRTAESREMSWRSFWNGGPNGPITDQWNVQGWPTIYVLDRDGVIRFKQVHEKKLDEAVELLVEEAETRHK